MNYEWQKRVIEDIDKGENMLLQMPRRAGKTEVVRQSILRRVQQAEQGGVYQGIAVIVPNFNQVSRYLSVLNHMFTRIDIHATENSRMSSGRNFSIHFISARDLDAMRGLMLNLIIVDDADNMELTNREMESYFRACLVHGDGTVLITATSQQNLFQSILNSPYWNQNYEYIYHKEHMNEWISGLLQWGMKNHSRENFVSYLKDIGFHEDIKMHSLNKNLKQSLITY